MTMGILVQQTPEGLQNASAGFASSTELMPMIVLVALSAIVLLIARPLVPALARSKVLGTVGTAITTSFAYALWGLATVISVGALVAPFYAITQLDAGTRQQALKWLGIGAGGYVALAVLGYGAKQVVSAYVDAHPDAESLGDLLPSEPEEEVAADGGEV